MTCKEYQDDLKAKAQNDADAKATMDALEAEIANGQAMRCLNERCGIVLMKNGGCEWLKCSMCGLEHCWCTKLRAGKGPGMCGGGHGCHF